MTEQTYTREDMARAWENGHSWGWDDAKTKAWAERGVDIGSRMTWRLLTPNPYERGGSMSANEPMPQEQLDAIQEREAKATPGPWFVEYESEECPPFKPYAHAIHGPTMQGVLESQVSDDYKAQYGHQMDEVSGVADADAQFMAHAREDIPALLAEVERLRALTTVDDDMVERAARAFYEYPTPGLDASFRTDWDRLTKASPEVADNYRAHTRAALDAALGTEEKTK